MINTTKTLFDLATGAVRGRVNGDAGEADANCAPGMAWIHGGYAYEETYIENWEPVPRPAHPAAVSALRLPLGQAVAVNGAPAGSAVFVEGAFYNVDGDFEIEFDTPGAKRIVVRSWPWRDAVFDVEVVL